jgi:hypothetical protein
LEVISCAAKIEQARIEQSSKAAKPTKSADDQPPAGHLFPEDRTIAARLRENLRAKYRE